eukprot:gene8853-18343_t
MSLLSFSSRVLILNLLFFYARLGQCDNACDGFMAVLIQRMPWKKTFEPCVDTFYEQDEYIALLSAQMVAMNSSLIIYTSYDPDPRCIFSYPNVKVEHFDRFELMESFGFSKLIPIMSSWSYIGYERASDIFRLLLAHKFQRTYIDTDIHLLHTNKDIYFQIFVGAAMWSDQKCSIEVTNSAFCLPRPILNGMISYLIQLITYKTDQNNYFYTEMGPSMFHKILLNTHAITLYSQNHPELHSINDITNSIQLYNHKMLHITGRIRTHWSPTSFTDIIHKIRKQINLTALSIPSSTRISTENDYYNASYINLLIMDYNLAGCDAQPEVQTEVKKELQRYKDMKRLKITTSNNKNNNNNNNNVFSSDKKENMINDDNDKDINDENRDLDKSDRSCKRSRRLRDYQYDIEHEVEHDIEHEVEHEVEHDIEHEVEHDIQHEVEESVVLSGLV